MIDGRSIIPWLCLCPLLAIARDWREGLAFAAGLLTCVGVTAGSLAMVRATERNMLRLPLAALIAGMAAVLEHLALAAWLPSLDAAVAPWLALVAGLAVLVCMQEPIPGSGSRPIPGRNDERVVHAFSFQAKIALQLSAALLVIGVARDGIGRVFLLAETPVGALVLLALWLAGINFAMHDPEDTSRMRAFSPLRPGPGSSPGQALRRDDEQGRSGADPRRGGERP